ncbi:hypothetical protein ACFSFZ_18860 [Mixta tenebrionis]|uniref:SH3 domain-containing protein n=1 Tax=Mixta tenebrionis TaxID=2562439 RepID=A0A506VEC5_9GAMM|nr:MULTISPECIES: hypothetical protein [Mixta]QHM76811.1 hypothetical protein C7M52_02794 [Mixta theicola]TPW43776.1 hypothetical protein FKM52_04365 [Mixta tenebrionis]
MFRKLALYFFILLSSMPTLAQKSSFDGVLQAYWLPVWNEDVNEPQLKYRFFQLENAGADVKIINVADNKLVIKLLEQDYPDFLTSQQGHVEYHGVITVKDLKEREECDMRFYDGTMMSFSKRNNSAKDISIDKLEELAGCQSYPYLITYTLKPRVKGVYLKNAPNKNAKKTVLVPSNKSLAQIQKINADWVLVAVYDESKVPPLGYPKGYIELDNLQPVN